jgi:polyisoprenoid-binding protein YceI
LTPAFFWPPFFQLTQGLNMNFRHALTTAAAVATLGAAASAHAQTTAYAIDPTHTFASFEVLHFGTSTIRGRFDKKEGTVQFDRAGKTGSVDITIHTPSVNTGVAGFDKHLVSKDFFNAAEFPTARFVSERLVFNGDKVSEVVGSFTLLGKTGPLVLKATNFNCYTSPILKREVCGGDFEATIDRTQWGMNTYVPAGQRGDVRLIVQVEAVKQ